MRITSRGPKGLDLKGDLRNRSLIIPVSGSSRIVSGKPSNSLKGVYFLGHSLWKNKPA